MKKSMPGPKDRTSQAFTSHAYSSLGQQKERADSLMDFSPPYQRTRVQTAGAKDRGLTVNTCTRLQAADKVSP